MVQSTVQRISIEKSSMNNADQAVYDWLVNHFGAQPEAFYRQIRWRTAWEAEIKIDGQLTTVLVRGNRGDGYVGPITMRQEAGIHQVLERHGVPAPRVYGVIDEPLAIVMEKIPGGINTALVESPEVRQSLRYQFIEALAKLYQIPVTEFAELGMKVPVTNDEAAVNLYSLCIDIGRKNISKPLGFAEFASRWLERNRPAGRDRIGFVTADSGQFMYEENRLTGLIDFEVSYIGDPAAEFAGMRLRDTTEPLGDISELCDYYESLTGDRISKAAIEYHSAGFAATNSMLMWPIILEPASDHDLIAYLQFTIATSRWGLSGMAEFAGIKPTDPDEPIASEVAFASVTPHLLRSLEAVKSDDETLQYQMSGAADLARYLDRCNRFGASILSADLADTEALTGETVRTREQADAAVDTFVRQAGPEYDNRLIEHFHRWLFRQNFLLKGCGSQSYLTESRLQPIPARPADGD